MVDAYGKPAARVAAACVVVALALPGYFLAERAYALIRFEIFEDEFRGSPPFRSRWEVLLTEEKRRETGRKISISTKRAMMRFPTAQSCLEADFEALTTEKLMRMNWAAKRNGSEVTVCIFRLLTESGEIGHATAWLEAQGFEVPDHYSGASPHVELDGRLRVYGIWSIRENGPRYDKNSLINRLLPDLAHSMTINATWSPEGQELQFVNVEFPVK